MAIKSVGSRLYENSLVVASKQHAERLMVLRDGSVYLHPNILKLVWGPAHLLEIRVPNSAGSSHCY